MIMMLETQILFSERFKTSVNPYKEIGYTMNIMEQIARMAVNPMIVDNFAPLFNCVTISRVLD